MRGKTVTNKQSGKGGLFFQDTTMIINGSITTNSVTKISKYYIVVA